MARKMYDEVYLRNIANAIREKTGSSDTYYPREMAAAIRNIESGADAITAIVTPKKYLELNGTSREIRIPITLNSNQIISVTFEMSEDDSYRNAILGDSSSSGYDNFFLMAHDNVFKYGTKNNASVASGIPIAGVHTASFGQNNKFIMDEIEFNEVTLVDYNNLERIYFLGRAGNGYQYGKAKFYGFTVTDKNTDETLVDLIPCDFEIDDFKSCGMYDRVSGLVITPYLGTYTTSEEVTDEPITTYIPCGITNYLSGTSDSNSRVLYQFMRMNPDMLSQKPANTYLQYVNLTGTKRILSNTLRDMPLLEYVNAPEAVYIGDNGLYSNPKLETVHFPKLSYLGSYAFKDCAKLNHVEFPEITTVQTQAFYNCSGLSSLILADGVAVYDSFLYGTNVIGFDFLIGKIYSNAFNGCNIEITPNFSGVNTIGDNAFGGSLTEAFENLSFGDELVNVGAECFGSSVIKNLYFRRFDTCTTQVFRSSPVISITFDNCKIPSITERAFRYCSSLEEIIFNNLHKITYGNDNMFEGATKILNKTGSIRVPHLMLDEYLLDSKWSQYNVVGMDEIVSDEINEYWNNIGISIPNKETAYLKLNKCGGRVFDIIKTFDHATQDGENGEIIHIFNADFPYDLRYLCNISTVVERPNKTVLINYSYDGNNYRLLYDLRVDYGSIVPYDFDLPEYIGFNERTDLMEIYPAQNVNYDYSLSFKHTIPLDRTNDKMAIMHTSVYSEFPGDNRIWTNMSLLRSNVASEYTYWVSDGSGINDTSRFYSVTFDVDGKWKVDFKTSTNEIIFGGKVVGTYVGGGSHEYANPTNTVLGSYKGGEYGQANKFTGNIYDYTVYDHVNKTYVARWLPMIKRVDGVETIGLYNMVTNEFATVYNLTYGYDEDEYVVPN